MNILSPYQNNYWYKNVRTAQKAQRRKNPKEPKLLKNVCRHRSFKYLNRWPPLRSIAINTKSKKETNITGGSTSNRCLQIQPWEKEKANRNVPGYGQPFIQKERFGHPDKSSYSSVGLRELVSARGGNLRGVNVEVRETIWVHIWTDRNQKRKGGLWVLPGVEMHKSLQKLQSLHFVEQQKQHRGYGVIFVDMHCYHSLNSKNQVISAVSRHDVADLSGLEFERYIFKGFLHLSSFEETQVSSFLAAWAFGIVGGYFWEKFGVVLELLLEILDVGNSLLSASGDGFIPEGIEGSSRFFMFLEDVCAVDWHI